jgi:hypothetical protein
MFLSGYDTLEYSWGESYNSICMLAYLFMLVKSTNKLSGTVAGERLLYSL